MTYTDFSSAWTAFLVAGFVIALIMGAIVNKTGFCTMGGVSDWVNMGDTGRMRAWVLAMGVAMIGVVVFEYQGWARPGDAFPPYRTGNWIWLESVVGGLMFGVGMTFASGCGNKNLVRLGGGNFKSLIVLFIIGVCAYFMVNAFPGTDQTLVSTFFRPWTEISLLELGSQDLGTLISGPEKALSTRLIIGLILGLGMIIFAFKSAHFRRDNDHVLAGIVVGLAVFAAWVITSLIIVDADGDLISLSAYYTDWEIYAESEMGKPAVGAPLSPQSYTFVNPMAQTLGYLVVGKTASNYLTFGIVAALGVIVGSFLWSLFAKTLRFEWFASFKDFYTHVIGAILMGIGATLALGCTIGQGVTGIATLAVGSFVTVAFIVLGSALTMKIQYYQMVYEEEATFMGALRSSLADMHLLPNSLRTLEKV